MADISSSNDNAALAALYWLKLRKKEKKTSSTDVGTFVDTAEVINLQFHTITFVLWYTVVTCISVRSGQR